MKGCDFCWRTAQWELTYESAGLRLCDKHMKVAEGTSRQVAAAKKPIEYRKRRKPEEKETQEVAVV